jgi:hypothetical protein
MIFFNFTGKTPVLDDGFFSILSFILSCSVKTGNDAKTGKTALKICEIEACRGESV